MRALTLSLLAALSMVCGAAAAKPTPAPAHKTAAGQTSSAIAAAVTNPARDPANVKMDESRKPAQVLTFLGLKPGMHVLDLFGANRYWAEIIGSAVGPTGSDTIWTPSQFYNAQEKAAFGKFGIQHPNVLLISTPLQSPAFGRNQFDFAIFNLNYHDLYVDHTSRGIPNINPREWLKSLYVAMKPGGIVGVIDHIANPGDTRATANALHRIDPNTLKADFESAGFVLAGTSDLLRNKADDHTLKVFDPKIRGNTDRAIFRFRKPA